jgi:integrase/recombinase XerD
MNGWYGSIARGMVALYIVTRVGPKERRLARIEDLNLSKMTFFIRHPKGEGSWAGPETIAIIRPDVVPMIIRHLDERKDRVTEHGLSRATALFPNLSQSPDGFCSANRFNSIKRMIEEESGISLRLKDFRSTLTSSR